MLRKIASVTAACALAVLAAAGTASAAPQTAPHSAPAMAAEHPHHHLYKGRVIARTGLLVRSAPNRNAPVVGSLDYGQTVWIECKVNGQWVDGNPRWYKLADGRWAWSSARYIANIGEAPRWCR
ncbi:SH3 domain-containing protein [Streptacidiphilus rugosus]|uniref:SH3 domain-containing protein n=1 Tax=Streptacidiphilus rugosus TaxID=405783 RepID=UPI000560DF7C|nr:SH3 domain-containing protein [Streptacidiphilus rugosus]